MNRLWLHYPAGRVKPDPDFDRLGGELVQKQHYVVLTVVYYKEDGDERWLAECRELGTASYGGSPEEARERIAEAIELHLTTLERYGERERFFTERGIKMLPHQPTKKELDITVPNDPRVFSQAYVHQFAGA